MRRVAVIAVATFALSASTAAAGVRITGVNASGYPDLQVTVTAPPGSARPSLEENGKPVTLEQAVSLAAGKSIVLAVDRSRSMAGRSLRNATAAARVLVGTIGAADSVEVIAFGHAARVVSPFSQSPGGALQGMAVDRVNGTALWDAVALAAQGLSRRPAGQGRVIVVVTDGHDVSSSTSLDGAVALANRAGAAVYTVGIASPDFTPAALQQLAAATGGAYREATSSAQLVPLYRSIGRSLARTWQLRYATAARPGDHVVLTAHVPGAGAGGRALTLPGTPSPSSPSTTVLPGSAWTSRLAPLVVAGAVGLLVLLAVLFTTGIRRSDWLAARLEPHVTTTRRSKRASHRQDARSALKRFFAATERAFADVKQFRTLQRMLVRADLPLLAAELVYLCLGAAVAMGVVGALAGASAIVVLLLVFCGGWMPVFFVALKSRARIRAFDEQLPDLLTTIAASLKAGHSFRHAIQSVVDEGADPAAKEFRRVLTETRLGRPMDDALTDLSTRIASKNLTFALTAVTIQRQIGGSLAGLFDMVADTVRQRQQFARKIRGLTAMGRMSAYVLVGLPFVVALAVTALNRSYMAPLWHTTTGHELVGAGLTMIAFGSLILRQIVTFRG